MNKIAKTQTFSSADNNNNTKTININNTNNNNNNSNNKNNTPSYNLNPSIHNITTKQASINTSFISPITAPITAPITTTISSPTPSSSSPTPGSSSPNTFHLQQQSFKYLSRQNFKLSLNLTRQKFQNHITISQNYDNNIFVKELQTLIFGEIQKMQFKQVKNNYIMASITDDLEDQLKELNEKLNVIGMGNIMSNNNINNNMNNNMNNNNNNSQHYYYDQYISLTPQQHLNIHMHIQGITKILVFIHGKSQFRLVMSHFHLGQSYLSNKCYQQAIDHFTISLKKNTKITQIKQTKIYHSYILTSLSQCYFELQLYEDALEILNRAYQIQQCYVNSELKINNVKTIKLISCCFLKLKNFKAAIQYIEKILPLVERLKGINSEEYVETKFQKSIISAQQGSLQSAIQQIKNAVQLLQSNQTLKPHQKNNLLIKYYHQLAQFQQKFGDYSAQVQCYRLIQSILSTFTFDHVILQNMLLIKKKIAIISINQGIFNLAIKQLEEILELEEENYGQDSQNVCKSLKMLGLIHLHLGNQKHTEEYFKKCYKISNNIKMNKKEKKQLQQIILLNLKRTSIIQHKPKLSVIITNNNSGIKNNININKNNLKQKSIHHSDKR